jgi:hypothetical protein
MYVCNMYVWRIMYVCMYNNNTCNNNVCNMAMAMANGNNGNHGNMWHVLSMAVMYVCMYVCNHGSQCMYVWQ